MYLITIGQDQYMSGYPTLEKLFYSDSSSERVEHVKAEAERRLNNPASFLSLIHI